MKLVKSLFFGVKVSVRKYLRLCLNKKILKESWGRTMVFFIKI